MDIQCPTPFVIISENLSSNQLTLRQNHWMILSHSYQNAFRKQHWNNVTRYIVTRYIVTSYIHHIRLLLTLVLIWEKLLSLFSDTFYILWTFLSIWMKTKQETIHFFNSLFLVCFSSDIVQWDTEDYVGHTYRCVKNIHPWIVVKGPSD